jgi:hypothetical protein
MLLEILLRICMRSVAESRCCFAWTNVIRGSILHRSYTSSFLSHQRCGALVMVRRTSHGARVHLRTIYNGELPILKKTGELLSQQTERTPQCRLLYYTPNVQWQDCLSNARTYLLHFLCRFVLPVFVFPRRSSKSFEIGFGNRVKSKCFTKPQERDKSIPASKSI